MKGVDRKPPKKWPNDVKSHPKLEKIAATFLGTRISLSSRLMIPSPRNTFFNEANNVDDLALQASYPYKAGRFPRSRFRKRWPCGWKILAFFSTIVA